MGYELLEEIEENLVTAPEKYARFIGLGTVAMKN